MTVCIAALFTWNYGGDGNADRGIAAITMSDRMITSWDIEYEPHQHKTCFLTPRVHILISGDYPSHSEALLQVQKRLLEENTDDVGEIARMYSDALANVRLQAAERAILKPLGLTRESFLRRQSDLAPEQVSNLVQQMQNWSGPETEAIIVGCDKTSAHLWTVGANGALYCQDDIGFAAIGIGAWHAKSQFMSSGWGKNISYAAALSIAYVAKKAAEIAPGVGSVTDMFLITRDLWQAVAPQLTLFLEEAYSDYKSERQKLSIAAINSVESKLNDLHQKARDAAAAATAASSAEHGDVEPVDQAISQEDA